MAYRSYTMHKDTKTKRNGQRGGEYREREREREGRDREREREREREAGENLCQIVQAIKFGTF